MSENKVALITGSAKRRLGWSIAQALAARGYAVVIHYNTSATEAEEAAAAFRQQGGAAMSLAADLSDEQQVRHLVEQTLERFGRLDALVNCAGTWKKKTLEEVTTADVRGHFEANTLATFLCCQHAGLAMTRQSEGGSIVNFGDWATSRPYTNYAAYFASKGAISTLTRCFAVELGTRNPKVRVNCIMPGPVLLPPDLSAAEREQAINATLAKREGRPENVVQAAIHFIDNDFLTGVCLPVDGGRTIYASDSELLEHRPIATTAGPRPNDSQIS
jgi:pteridine reductase